MRGFWPRNPGTLAPACPSGPRRSWPSSMREDVDLSRPSDVSGPWKYPPCSEVSSALSREAWMRCRRQGLGLCSRHGSYEAAGNIITEGEFASWTDPAARRPKTWLLIDREVDDGLCPGAATHRRDWQEAMERHAEAASHPDNLVPVARASRADLRFKAEMLRRHAAALRGESRGTQYGVLVNPGRQQIAAADLDAVAQDLESWTERDWIAVIDLGPERQNLEHCQPTLHMTQKRRHWPVSGHGQ